MFRRAPAVVFALLLSLLAARANPPDTSNCVVISVREQKLMLLQNGARTAVYPISTSKFGLGDNWGRMTTPLGWFQVAQKIGDHAPVGAVFHNRRWTGEILSPNTPGRDPVITRIIWLRGLELQNAHAFSRCIYIHGTPEERLIGRPASYGCIRMKSNDIAALYAQLAPGTLVQIVSDRLPKVAKTPRNPPGDLLAAKDDKPKIEDRPGATAASGSLTVEQMRMAGALAGEREKRRIGVGQTGAAPGTTAPRPGEKTAPVLNKGATTAQNSPRA